MSAAPAPLEPGVDHVRGPAEAPVVLVYGDFECPYTRAAYREIQGLERRGEPLRFGFRHFPLTEIHPHALARRWPPRRRRPRSVLADA
jgi:Na+:H+ antiporter, NhaA family